MYCWVLHRYYNYKNVEKHNPVKSSCKIYRFIAKNIKNVQVVSFVVIVGLDPKILRAIRKKRWIPVPTLWVRDLRLPNRRNDDSATMAYIELRLLIISPGKL